MNALSALIAVALLTAPATGSDATIGAEARKRYQEGKYELACPAFERLTKASPKDGAAWADLGLCLFKEGKKSAAIDATTNAIRLGDRKTRRSAYFNLDLMGVSVELPKPNRCRKLPQTKLLACRKPFSFSGSGGGSSGESLTVGLNSQAVDTDDRDVPAVSELADAQRKEAPAQDSTVSFPLKWDDEDFCRCPGTEPDCQRECGKDVEHTTCSVVYASGVRLGVLCHSTTGEKKKTTTALEFSVSPDD